jgi:hypothetical protein
LREIQPQTENQKILSSVVDPAFKLLDKADGQGCLKGVWDRAFVSSLYHVYKFNTLRSLPQDSSLIACFLIH